MAEAVKAAFTAFLREGALSHAAKWLNDHGFTVKRTSEGGGSHARLGHFTVDNLQALLRNKSYLGVKVYTVKGEQRETKAVWPAIIDESTFIRAGKLLDKNRHRLKPWKDGRMPYILSGTVHCQACRSHMPGKSATGNGGKVGYYEHAWATKRDSTLSKKIFRCEPIRVPAKKLEPLVWEKFKLLLSNKAFLVDILERVRKHHQANPTRKEQERLRAKISGLTSQLDGLAERIAELPRRVSAEPLFKQMARLETLKKDHEEGLLELSNGGYSKYRIVGLESFESFASHYKRFLREGMTVPEKKQAIQKFIRKVEVTTETVRIHFIVDEDHYKRELASSEAGSRPSQGNSASDFKSYGSNTLTFGAQVEQVDEHPGTVTTFIFEMEAYPEAKSLIGTELKYLYRKFKSWPQVAKAVGSSESFVRQNSGHEK